MFSLDAPRERRETGDLELLERRLAAADDALVQDTLNAFSIAISTNRRFSPRCGTWTRHRSAARSSQLAGGSSPSAATENAGATSPARP
ncbi:MAG: hypothetical protein U0166_14700 [Acidobacteriota bacterium]